MELWSRRDPVTPFGAAGTYKSGVDELSRIFPCPPQDEVAADGDD